MYRLFPLALVGCIAEARTPPPGDVSALTHRIRLEAFPGDLSPQAWERAWRIACAALSGTAGPDAYGPDVSAAMIATCCVTKAGEPPLRAEVYACATDAHVRVLSLMSTGSEARIMAPNGHKLSGDDLAGLADDELRIRQAVPPGSSS